MHHRLCTAADAPQVMHSRWWIACDTHQVMQLMWCTKSDALISDPRSGDAQQVMHRKLCTAGDHRRWCTVSEAQKVMHRRSCTAGDAQQMMQCRWCTADDAQKVMYRRWCTAGDAQKVMQWDLIQDQSDIWYDTSVSGLECLIVLLSWWFHHKSLSHALITGSCCY